MGQRQRQAGDLAGALASWDTLHRRHPSAFLLVADAYAQTAVTAGSTEAARQTLQTLFETLPAIELLQALQKLDGGTSESQLPRLRAHLQQHPTLSAAQMLLAHPPGSWGEGGLEALRLAVALAAKPLQRYRCAACGFEAQHYFWQCPGCLNWDSYPTQRIDAL
jgi:lipopolysaccharide assembly protein B